MITLEQIIEVIHALKASISGDMFDGVISRQQELSSVMQTKLVDMIGEAFTKHLREMMREIVGIKTQHTGNLLYRQIAAEVVLNIAHDKIPAFRGRRQLRGRSAHDQRQRDQNFAGFKL